MVWTANTEVDVKSFKELVTTLSIVSLARARSTPTSRIRTNTRHSKNKCRDSWSSEVVAKLPPPRFVPILETGRNSETFQVNPEAVNLQTDSRALEPHERLWRDVGR